MTRSGLLAALPGRISTGLTWRANGLLTNPVSGGAKSVVRTVLGSRAEDVPVMEPLFGVLHLGQSGGNYPQNDEIRGLVVSVATQY